MTTKTQKPAKKIAKKARVIRTTQTHEDRQPKTKSRGKVVSTRPTKKEKAANAMFQTKRLVAQKLNLISNSDGLKGQGLIQVGNAKKLELRERLGMARPIFGRMVNVAERTIAKVESGDETPDKLKRPYNEVYRLWEALSELVDPTILGQWFQYPNESFDGLKPIEVIERGEIDRLWDMVFELQTGMPG